MSYIQLPYGYVKNKQIQFNLPRNYENSQYIKRLSPYITNKVPDVENKVLNALKNRDFKKWLLAMSDYGQEIQEDLNAIVAYDEINTIALLNSTMQL